MARGNKSQINSIHELKEIKSRLKKEIDKTESKFIRDSDALSNMIDNSGVYKKSKHAKGKSKLHAYIIQIISEGIEKSCNISQKQKEIAKIAIPSIVLGLSLLLVNKYNKKEE